jgi:hypothetical protein
VTSEIKEHKYNFIYLLGSLSDSGVILDLGLASEFCQTVGNELFFLLDISF